MLSEYDFDTIISITKDTEAEDLCIRAIEEIKQLRTDLHDLHAYLDHVKNSNLSAKQVPLGEITQDMLNKYYVYLEVSGSNELVFTITPSGNERVVFVRTASGERIRLTSTLAIVTSVPK